LAERLDGVTFRTAVCIMGGFLTLFLSQIGTALAYPTVDPTNQDTLLPPTAPQGTELPETDINGLQNQLRLTNPAAVPNANVWTIIPRVTVQQLFTDNVFEAESPRRADAITVISPGISALADTARLKLNLDYQPDVLLHAIDGPLNAMTQHLTATGLVTIVPDLAFIDLRALSGVQSTSGALGTTGNLGGGYAGPQYSTPGQTGTNPRNEVQTSSVGISPYLSGSSRITAPASSVYRSMPHSTAQSQGSRPIRSAAEPMRKTCWQLRKSPSLPLANSWAGSKVCFSPISCNRGRRLKRVPPSR